MKRLLLACLLSAFYVMIWKQNLLRLLAHEMTIYKSTTFNWCNPVCVTLQSVQRNSTFQFASASSNFLRTFYCSPNRNEWIIRNCNNVERREKAGGMKKSFIKTTIREIRLSWVIYYSIQLLVPRCCHISFIYLAIRLILCRIKVIGKIAHPRDYSWILFLASPTDRHCQYLRHLSP